MAIIYDKVEEKTKLQQRVLADLRAKQSISASDEGNAINDGGEPEPGDNATATGRLRILILAVVVVIVLLMVVNNK